MYDVNLRHLPAREIDLIKGGHEHVQVKVHDHGVRVRVPDDQLWSCLEYDLPVLVTWLVVARDYGREWIHFHTLVAQLEDHTIFGHVSQR